MEEIHGGETQLMLGAFDFEPLTTVLDVGGGNGSTLSGILKAHPRLRRQLFELPHVAENAREQLQAAGLADRVEIHAGDFFEQVPGKADCIVLRHVLHDWSDADCARILKNVGRALTDTGSLLIVENVITPGNEPNFVKLLDVNMMAIGGKERTEAQYRALLATTDLHIHAIHTTPGPIDIAEARTPARS